VKISYKEDYALKVILDLASHTDGELVHIEDIAKRQDIPRKYLEQLLLQLKRGGYIRSKKGPNGGYFLAKNPGDITMGDIVRFFQGSLAPISCIDGNDGDRCDFEKRCAFFDVWKLVSSVVSDVLDNVNFKDLAVQSQRLEEVSVGMYHI
jgi:Rrf2 family protein